jgi:hypothetical protein
MRGFPVRIPDVPGMYSCGGFCGLLRLVPLGNKLVERLLHGLGTEEIELGPVEAVAWVGVAPYCDGPLYCEPVAGL